MSRFQLLRANWIKGLPIFLYQQATVPLIEPMNRKRDDRGRYTKEIDEDDVLDTLRAADTPVMTAKQVAETLGCSGEAARQKLTSLEEEGRAEKMRVGARAVVWWPTD